MRYISKGGWREKLKELLSKKRIIVFLISIAVIAGGFFLYSYIIKNKKNIVIKSLTAMNRIVQLLPIRDDIKNEIQALDKLVEEFTKKDDTVKTFLILLQNNMELRPGGGFLGQYAIIKIKNGEVVSSLVEDANLLDQRITAKINPPYPFRQMMQIKKWKLRDSNFSPDFPTNVEKAEYFLRLGGRGGVYDGVIAVNATVLNDILEITGPINVPGYSAEFNSENAVLKLEEIVEKAYIMNPELDTQNRKAIMRKMSDIIIEKLASIGNVRKIAELAHKEMQNKNIMLNFKNEELQKLAESVHWDGGISKDWGSDYLMAVDANMGALKTDYYMKREISYDVDLTQEKPTVTLNILYKNTAPYGDWRTSDYHAYGRVYAPEGSVLLERKMVGPPITRNEFNKTYFGFKVDVVMGRETNAMIKYQLPDRFKNENYRLLVQKQSGVGDIPIKIHVKTKDGESDYSDVLKKDLRVDAKK